MTAAAFVALIALAPSAQDNAQFQRHIYPLAPAMTCPPIVIDVTDSPESEAWANTAKALVEEWYGKLTQMLATDGVDPLTGEKSGRAFSAPAEIKLVFKADLNVPAYASGGTITINGAWIKQRPDDFGMVIHELTHVVQQYRRAPGWLTEGIADYTRWWRYEPELHATGARTVVNFETAKHTDAYRTTAKFLAWTSKKYDMRLVPCLDLAMRSGEDPLPLFEKITGKSVDDLWKEFAADTK